MDLLRSEFNSSSVMEESISEVNPAEADNLMLIVTIISGPWFLKQLGRLTSFRPQSYQLDIRKWKRHK